MLKRTTPHISPGDRIRHVPTDRIELAGADAVEVRDARFQHWSDRRPAVVALATVIPPSAVLLGGLALVLWTIGQEDGYVRGPSLLGEVLVAAAVTAAITGLGGMILERRAARVAARGSLAHVRLDPDQVAGVELLLCDDRLADATREAMAQDADSEGGSAALALVAAVVDSTQKERGIDAETSHYARERLLRWYRDEVVAPPTQSAA